MPFTAVYANKFRKGFVKIEKFLIKLSELHE